ncbi:multidrug transporter [Bacillus sp. FJAT-27264]|uniref:EamA family transporter n=1 Tax=Paenibacillus sp. (strain DSM 101736 / FJAT-27264) TaxID=1850362 RepID=UPI000807C507|nr:DMT family transporter [Bacillus sp. FJAT-27264]OBZ12080.1 multidrug transporter [Bacillus sp. FJAT-27264]
MKYIAAVMIGSACFGLLSTIAVLAYGRGFQLGEVVGSQFFWGFVLSLAFYLVKNLKTSRHEQKAASNETEDPKLSWKQKLTLISAGLPLAGAGLVYFKSLIYVPASVAIILLFQFIWIGALIQSIRNRRLPDRMTVIVIVILLLGTVLAAGLLDDGIRSWNPIGILYGLSAALLYSLFILLSGSAVPKAPAATRAVWMLAGGMVLIFILYPPAFLFNGKIFGELLIYGFTLGFLGSFIPPLLFAYGVPHVGEGMASILGATELPVAVLSSFFILHEPVSPLRWVGVLIVLTSIALPEIIRRFTQKRSLSRA